MQEFISQIAALGIKITPTTSLIIIFGIIFLTAIVVHLFCTKWCCAPSKSGRRPVATCGCKLLPRTNCFIVWPSPCRGLSSTCRRCCGCKRQRGRGVITHLRAAVGDDLRDAILFRCWTWCSIYRRNSPPLLSCRLKGYFRVLSWSARLLSAIRLSPY